MAWIVGVLALMVVASGSAPRPTAVADYGPIAVARSPVRVHAGTAVLVLACHNAPCEGVAKLVAQVGPPPPEREPGDEGRKVLIGSAPFSLAAETTRELQVRLNRRGRRMVHRAKASGRYALLAGSGLRHRTLLLKRVSSPAPGLG